MKGGIPSFRASRCRSKSCWSYRTDLPKRVNGIFSNRYTLSFSRVDFEHPRYAAAWAVVSQREMEYVFIKTNSSEYFYSVIGFECWKITFLSFLNELCKQIGNGANGASHIRIKMYYLITKDVMFTSRLSSRKLSHELLSGKNKKPQNRGHSSGASSKSYFG